MISFNFNRPGHHYVIRYGETVVGRDRGFDVSLFFDDTVGARQAELLYRSGRLVVRDMVSNNGTFVRGADIGAGGIVEVRSGDTLRVGGRTFKVLLLDEREVGAIWPEAT